ncbi:MAG: hypothetical protein ACR2JV_06385 [Gaiellales bacterium]
MPRSLILLVALLALLAPTAQAARLAPALYKPVGGLAMDPGGESYYVQVYSTDEDHNQMKAAYGSGFSWYSTLWPLFVQPVAGEQAGLSSSWITPNAGITTPNYDSCETDTRNPIVQTIEGSLGWWGDTPYRVAMPKYEPGVTRNCYSSGAREFWGGRPIKRNDGGWITISNRILLPPDGMTFTASSSGAQLGQAWFALPLPATGSALGVPTGPNAWTLFLNATNFQGPIAYVEPHFWSLSAKGAPQYAGRTLDAVGGLSFGIGSEWAMLPYFQAKAADGSVYSRMPALQFPTDAAGRTIFTRDYTGYGPGALFTPMASAIATGTPLPGGIDPAGVRRFTLQADTHGAFQSDAELPEIEALAALQVFDGGASAGFQSAKPNAMIRWPEYFRQQGGQRTAVAPASAPSSLRQASFASPPGSAGATPPRAKVYQTPAWFNRAPAASGVRTTRLNDGSTVSYRWYRFVDQPLLRRFRWTASEKTAMQAAIVRMQREWAHQPLMAPPSGGRLATFDKGLLVTPPRGLEFGYVPIVVRQASTR